MRAELKRIQSELGVTTVYVTHDQAEAMAISGRIAVLNQGLLMQIGGSEEIYERPTSEFVASFIGRSNILTGRLQQDVADNQFGLVESSIGPVPVPYTHLTLPTNLRVRISAGAPHAKQKQ